MRLIFSTLLALLLILTSAIPTPLNTTDTAHIHGLPGGVYMCNNINFTGLCYWNHPIPGIGSACLSLIYPKEDGNPTLAISIGPDQGTKCDLFGGTAACDGYISSIEYPGIRDVRQVAPLGARTIRCYAG